MKKFILGWLLMVLAIPITMALHYFMITKLPYLTGEDYRRFINSICLASGWFQVIAGFTVLTFSSSKL